MIQLQTLSADERAFLAAPAAEPAAPAELDWLQRTLAATLAARLRLAVSLDAKPADAPAGRVGTPLWQPDSAFATLWLTRRLGGARTAGHAPFVPRSLIETLDAMLAEAWLGNPARHAVPTLVWDVITPLGTGRLALQLPDDASDLTRWARGVIRHA